MHQAKPCASKGIAKDSLFPLSSGPLSACFSEGPTALMGYFPAKGSGIPSPLGTGRRSHGQASGTQGGNGAHTTGRIIDIVVVERTVRIDVGGIVLIIAGRPQPPPDNTVPG